MSPCTRSGDPRHPHDGGEEDLRRIVDLIPQTIVVLDPDGRAVYANQRATEYTGLSLADMSADDFRGRVFHTADVERLREERQRRLSGTVLRGALGRGDHRG
jgi:PAS domain S-box-containing protein